MKTAKILMWIIGLGAVGLLASLDLNALSDWNANRVFIMSDEVYSMQVDVPWEVELIANRPHPFGGYEDVVIPADQYTLTMKPLDDHSEEFAEFADGTLTCSRRALLHVEFFLELLPDSDFQFNGDDPQQNRFRQLIAVDIDPEADWEEIDLAVQPEHIQRHIDVISRTELDGANYAYFPWRPEGVVSKGDVTLMTDACVSSMRGIVRLGGRYFLFDGDHDDEIPVPPTVLGSPATCVFDNQWILAGGDAPEIGYDIPQVVYAFDLTAREWSKLPTLPDEIIKAEAVFERDGELVAVARIQNSPTDDISPPATFVLRDGEWQKDQDSTYDFGVGNVFGVKTGVLSVETQNLKATIKHLERGRLQTIAVTDGYSSTAPVTVVDNRVLQWRNGRIYELNPYLFLDQADIESANQNEEANE